MAVLWKKWTPVILVKFADSGRILSEAIYVVYFWSEVCLRVVVHVARFIFNSLFISLVVGYFAPLDDLAIFPLQTLLQIFYTVHVSTAAREVRRSAH